MNRENDRYTGIPFPIGQFLLWADFIIVYSIFVRQFPYTKAYAIIKYLIGYSILRTISKQLHYHVGILLYHFTLSEILPNNCLRENVSDNYKSLFRYRLQVKKKKIKSFTCDQKSRAFFFRLFLRYGNWEQWKGNIISLGFHRANKPVHKSAYLYEALLQ